MRAHAERSVRWKAPSHAAIVAQLQARTSETIVGETHDAEMVAMFRLDLARTFHGVARFTPVPTSVYLLDFAVHPAQQKQGGGRAMLAEVERRAQAHGAEAVRLDVNHDAIGACDFYVACGYRVVLRYADTFYLERLLR